MHEKNENNDLFKIGVKFIKELSAINFEKKIEKIIRDLI